LLLQSTPFLPGFREKIEQQRISKLTQRKNLSLACATVTLRITSSWTQRKWTERQNLLFSTVAPGMAAVVAVSARYTCKRKP